MHTNPQIAALLKKLYHPALPGIDLTLARMEQLLAALGYPEKKLPPIIHVAGTDGKGSTIAFLRAMLEAGGKRVHVNTSPHMVRFNERMVLAGEMVADAELLEVLIEVENHVRAIPATFFEATTAAAFLALARVPADIMLLEVGMGGRLDATNVVTPIASIITSVGFDHQEFLGNSLAAIAAEKAGIIKHRVPVITCQQAPEVMDTMKRIAAEKAAPFYSVAPLALPVGMQGRHQQENAALAVEALRVVFPVSEEAVQRGLKKARWPGRLQKITHGPWVELLGEFWLDSGHNAHAAQALATWAVKQEHPVMLVCGMLERKDAAGFFRELHGAVDKVVTIAVPVAEDGQSPQSLCDIALGAGHDALAVAAIADLAQIHKRYRPATVLVAGSLYMAGEILKNHE
jgi:dihydrofolate synthase/folylpolyglutamate synthase